MYRISFEKSTKKQFRKQPDGLRQFREYRWKALGKENSDLSGLFLFGQYSESYIEQLSKKCPNKNSPIRFRFASSNTLVPRSQTLLRCLDPCQIDFLVSSGSQADLRELDNIVFARTSDNSVCARSISI